MPSASPKRRPIDLTPLEEHAAKVKLRAAIVLPDTKKKAVSLPRDSFVPVIQAEVGTPIPLLVHRYRLLVPIAQIIRDSVQAIRRTEVATSTDIDVIREALIRHFGGVTVLHQPPAPASGIGARDPSNVTGTLEHNEHLAFEVYAAPIQESDNYFRAVRQELQEALQEGVILIERHQVTLI
jgi:hypothetical protein